MGGGAGLAGDGALVGGAVVTVVVLVDVVVGAVVVVFVVVFVVAVVVAVVATGARVVLGSNSIGATSGPSSTIAPARTTTRPIPTAIDATNTTTNAIDRTASGAVFPVTPHSLPSSPGDAMRIR